MHKVLDYVLQNFFLNFKVDFARIDIGYGIKNKAKITVVDRGREFFNGHSSYDINQVVWDHWEGVDIPFLFHESRESDVVVLLDNGQVIIRYDVFASIFFFLSGWQEYVSDIKDQYGRFPFEVSVQKGLGIVGKPIVNYYYSIICRAIELAYGIKVRPVMEELGFVTFISHDIDKCMSGWKEGGFSEFKRLRFSTVASLVIRRLKGKDVWFNFADILIFNQLHGIPSTFFFLPRKGRNISYKLHNADYDVTRPVFSRVIKRIKDSGSEVAVHGSLGAGFDKRVMEEDIQKLGVEISGNRIHYLLYDIKCLPAILDHCQLAYDNSTCFAEHVGFRHSTCSPFYLYDFQHKRSTKSIEIPLVIMDRTFSNTKYMNLDHSEIINMSQDIISEVKKFNGILSILWHNHHFSPYKFTGWKERFEQLISNVKTEGTTFMNGEQIIKFLNEKAKGEDSK